MEIKTTALSKPRQKDVVVVNDIMDFGFSYYIPFRPYGRYRSVSMMSNPQLVNLDDARLVVFTGGADINPALYGEPKHPLTNYQEKRDFFEIQIFRKAREKNIPCFGICRGAQFLCAMAGGKLNQHSPNHHWRHELVTNDGREFITNSSHHQVQLPPASAILAAWTFSPNGKKEAEAVEYPNINAAGVQFHPEAMNTEDEAFMYTREMIEKLLGV